jgi:SAM-dependent methyltransferase
MTERTAFYPERFKNASRFYTSGRPTYPRLLARRVATLVGLSKRHDVLDLGTGPGFLAIDFAPFAGKVVAVDPSAEMLAAAARNASEAGTPIRFVQASSYELGGHLGKFGIVTIGRAFHWMDRRETLKALDALVETGGAVALFGTRQPDVPQNAWYRGFQDVIDSYSTDDPARPHTRGAHEHEALLLESAFDHLERVAVLERRRTPIDRFVDRALSFASTWHGRPNFRESELAVDIREVITPHADAEGLVLEVLEGQALVARRTRDVAAD